MKRQLLAVSVFATAAAVACSFAYAQNTEENPLKPGDVAPEFVLEGTDVKTYELSDFKNESAVVVAWYPKALTGG